VLALEDAFDLDVLERRLMAFAIHPDGLAAQGAWLFSWNEARGRFDLGSVLRVLPAGVSLTDALKSPGLPPPRGEEDGIVLDPLSLEPPLEAAWTRGAADAAEVAPGLPRPWQGVVGALPLRWGLRPYALLVLSWNDGPVPARVRDLAALQRLAGRATETLERAGEGRRRLRQGEALREMTRLAVSSVNLAEALRVAVRVAAHGTSARGTALWLGSGAALRLEATHGPAGRREAIARVLETLAAESAESARPVLLEPGDPRLAIEGDAPLRALALIPLLAFGQVRGTLAVYDPALPHRAGSRAFDAADREFLTTLGDLIAALAAEADRFDQLRNAERRHRELESQIARLERLAAAGERTAGWLKEARQPLASIAAFARRMQRTVEPGHPHHEYLEIMVREAERIERRCAEPATPAVTESALRVESVNSAVQEVLQESSERLVRRRIRLLKRLAPDLPALLMDPESLRRTLRNIVGQALDRVAVGGRIRVESRRAPHHLVVDVSHDGARHPGEMLEELFAPFAEKTQGAPEPGLALARRIVREHGGEVRLRSEGEWTSIVSLTLPIAENRDRRGARERRSARSDRRASGAEA
jgi:signal transduction histidine kinase